MAPVIIFPLIKIGVNLSNVYKGGWLGEVDWKHTEILTANGFRRFKVDFGI